VRLPPSFHGARSCNARSLVGGPIVGSMLIYERLPPTTETLNTLAIFSPGFVLIHTDYGDVLAAGSAQRESRSLVSKTDSPVID